VLKEIILPLQTPGRRRFVYSLNHGRVSVGGADREVRFDFSELGLNPGE
jgi:hypothetical protein